MYSHSCNNYIYHSERESEWIVENNKISPKNNQQVCYSFGELTAHIYIHRSIHPSGYS